MNRIFITLLSLLGTNIVLSMDVNYRNHSSKRRRIGYTITPDQHCPICFESIHGRIVSSDILFGCHHTEENLYHDACMAHWLNTRRQNTSCPLCNAHLLDLHQRLAEFNQQPLIAAVLAGIYYPATVEVPITHFDAEILINATRNGDLELIDACLNAGVNVNALDDDGRTALDIAITLRNHEIRALLLAHGAQSGSQLI